MNRQEWFSARKWGMFNHFLGLTKAGTSQTCYRSYRDFNERVEAFDAAGYARTAHEVNAGYVVFTLMQGSRFLCAPNDTFDDIAGFRPGEACSRRDLIADLITELDRYDIPLFLYYTGDGPYMDPVAGPRFGYHNREEELVNRGFVEKWTAVMEEFALRYGRKVHGWWLDGMFNYLGYEGHEDEFFALYRAAAEAGNPDTLMAFNNGVHQPRYNDPAFAKYLTGVTHPMQKVRVLEKAALEGDEALRKTFANVPGNSCRYTRFEDFTAGEDNVLEELPRSKYVEGSLWHKLCHLGIARSADPLWGKQGWSMAGCQYSGEYLVDYVKKCSDVGGVVSLETHLFDDGHIDWGQYEMLKKLGELRK